MTKLTEFPRIFLDRINKINRILGRQILDRRNMKEMRGRQGNIG
jgi:hypothetical protein